MGLGIHDERLELPVGISSDGPRMVTLREVRSADAPTVDFLQLSLERKAELTAERIQRQPELILGMVGAGIVDKECTIREVKARLEVGKPLIEIEQRTITHLIKKATNSRVLSASAWQPDLRLPQAVADNWSLGTDH